MCGVCSVIEFRAFVVCYRAKEKGEKTCGIIDAVDNFRLIIQVSSIDDREYRRRRNAPKSREAAFRRERAVTGGEVNDRVVVSSQKIMVNTN